MRNEKKLPRMDVSGIVANVNVHVGGIHMTKENREHLLIFSDWSLRQIFHYILYIFDQPCICIFLLVLICYVCVDRRIRGPHDQCSTGLTCSMSSTSKYIKRKRKNFKLYLNFTFFLLSHMNVKSSYRSVNHFYVIMQYYKIQL